MTPKQKAKELVDRFKPYAELIEGTSDNTEEAKQCALICVNEVIDDRSKRG